MNHIRFLYRCLELAARGRGKTGINPLVGAVLVRDGRIIAEAFHEEFGKPHAERALLEEDHPPSPRLRGASKISSNDTLYVSLEPCCHSGKKTPPCAQLLVERGVKRVGIGMIDPNPAVAGKGIEYLRKNGVEVIGPLMPAECVRQNRGFVSLMRHGRPWITLHEARTIDGRHAKPDGSPLKITNEEQDEWSHEFLRAKHDAILVGIGTVLSDDPQLTVRRAGSGDRGPGSQPYRIVLDAEGRLPADAKVRGDRLMHITKNDVPVKDGMFDWSALWKKLTTPSENFYGISSILVEGGPKTWKFFKDAKMADEEVILVGGV